MLKYPAEKARAQESSEEDSDVDDNPIEVPKISYTLTTLSVNELKKPAARRKSKSHLLDISSGLEWIDAKAHLKIAICDLLFPGQAEIDDNKYELTWSIPRIAPTPLSLHTASDYEQLVKKCLKLTEPAVKVCAEEVEQHAPVMYHFISVIVIITAYFSERQITGCQQGEYSTGCPT